MSSTTNSTNSSFGRVADQTADTFRDAATNTADAARRAGQEIGAAARTEFNNILSDLQDLASRAAKASGRELTVLRSQMSDKLGAAKEKLGSLSGEAGAAARKGIDATGEVIQDRPFQAVAVAALAGFVIGLLVSTRR
jgi:ElaB/YqjD/DUF883 family membrane-anchored ribosome-binding protein